MEERQSVLVVDDEPNIRNLVSEILGVHDFDVLQATSGPEALEMAATRAIDAFLIDLDMPVMGGVELCRRLRSMERFRLSPIIFLTASGEDANVSEAFAAGGDDFVTKPFNQLLLRARLKVRFEKVRYFQQLERTRATLNKYLSTRTLEIVERATRTGIVPGPEDRDLTICFTDMRGFTAFSEDLEPRQLFSIVSSHLAEQVTTVHGFGGYIDKFGGDGIMAIFDGPNMVLQSCLCALSIIQKGAATAKSAGTLPLGIGIHTGRATIGNLGSPEHLDYSAIGTAVNIAARLCGQAAPGTIAVSKAVYDLAVNEPQLKFHNERSVPIKGLKEHVTIYTLSPAEE